MKKVDIVILNYDGMELLKECLPSIVKASDKTSYDCKVTLLDNRSTDNSVDFVKENYPAVNIYVASENKVLCSYNEYLEKSDCDVAILLNNDIKVSETFVDPLVKVFEEDKDAFMVTPKSFFFDNSYDGGKSVAFMNFGIFSSTCRFRGYDKYLNLRSFTFAGGFGAVDRKKFLELGGYDDLYLPGRLEDADICFRAWKKGYKCFNEPKSVVYHKGCASFDGHFGSKKTLVINFRNVFLFMWKNIREGRLLFEHVFFLAPRLLVSLIRRKPEMFYGFLKALPKMRQAVRRTEKYRYPMKDSEIFIISRG